MGVASLTRESDSQLDRLRTARVEPKGLVNGANALRYWQARQQVVANNLANAETHGFKGERVFARLLGDNLVAPEAATDFRQGTLTPTERPLDLALEGDGFFVVQTEAGERLTRGGPMRLDESGRIVDGMGNVLLGEHGPMIVPQGAGEVAIAETGEVLVDDVAIDRLRVELPAEGTNLFHEAGALFRAEGGMTPLEASTRRVRQGHLEASNVGTLDSMVDMINIQRAYAAVHNSLQVSDGVLDTIANQIGRLS
jgi:flagellar basal-body rod protein FlgF